MSTHQDRIEAIKAELIDPRNVRPMADVARELIRLKQSGCDWPAGSVHEWYAAIYELVERGYLEIEHGTHVRRTKVSIDVAEPEAKPATPKPVQLDLF